MSLLVGKRADLCVTSPTAGVGSTAASDYLVSPIPTADANRTGKAVHLGERHAYPFSQFIFPIGCSSGSCSSLTPVLPSSPGSQGSFPEQMVMVVSSGVHNGDISRLRVTVIVLTIWPVDHYSSSGQFPLVKLSDNDV